MGEMIGHFPPSVERREQRIDIFKRLAEIPESKVAESVETAIKNGLTTPDDRDSFLHTMGTISAVVLEGVLDPDPKGLGWREPKVEDLNLTRIAQTFGLEEEAVFKAAHHMVESDLIKSKERQTEEATRRKRNVNGSMDPQFA